CSSAVFSTDLRRGRGGRARREARRRRRSGAELERHLRRLLAARRRIDLRQRDALRGDAVLLDERRLHRPRALGGELGDARRRDVLLREALLEPLARLLGNVRGLVVGALLQHRQHRLALVELADVRDRAPEARALLDLLAQRLLAQPALVLGAGTAAQLDAQRGRALEELCEPLDQLLAVLGELGATRTKRDRLRRRVLDLSTGRADRHHQLERRGDGAEDRLSERLADDRAQRDARAAAVAGDRDIERNLSIEVGEQRER